MTESHNNRIYHFKYNKNLPDHIIMTEKVVVLLINSIFLVAGEDLFDALYVFGLVLGDKAY